MTELKPVLTQAQRGEAMGIARKSIQYGLNHGAAFEPDPSAFSEALIEPGAAFVTLEKHGALRGCIGSVEIYRPLVEDIAENAWNAAFGDPRFPGLTPGEYDDLDIEISILTAPETFKVQSEEDLKARIVPGRDGLILEKGYRRGLFLPAVWDKLPDVDAFLAHLKQKAGFPLNYWSDSIEVKRFYTYEFCDDDI